MGLFDKIQGLVNNVNEAIGGQEQQAAAQHYQYQPEQNQGDEAQAGGNGIVLGGGTFGACGSDQGLVFTYPEPDQNRVYGPFLRFGGYDPETRILHVSVLVVVHQALVGGEPSVYYNDQQAQFHHLDEYAGFNFWRADMALECVDEQRHVEYRVSLPGAQEPQPRTIVVPGANQKWHWGFYSCNGFHDPQMEIDAGGIQPLWSDVLQVHEQNPFHVMLGGGDQLYNDPIWKCPALVQWLSVKGADRFHTPFEGEIAQQSLDFYFKSYLKHWTQPKFGDALAMIPQAMTWDDHDIFDGWGSYPDQLHSCPVFQGVFHAARKFYGLFQHHTTPERATQLNNVFGETGWNFLTCLGATSAALVLDCRTERNKSTIIHPNSWAMAKARIAGLPPTVVNVMMLATVPVAHPKLPAVESALGYISDGHAQRHLSRAVEVAGNTLSTASRSVLKFVPEQVKRGMQTHVQNATAMVSRSWNANADSAAPAEGKSGLANKLMANFDMAQMVNSVVPADAGFNQFGTVEILDDLMDHWSADEHMEEKKSLVRMMQELSLARGFRFTLLGGDVHVGAVGRFESTDGTSPENDHRFVTQITSSGIGNLPPGEGVIKVQSAVAKPKDLFEETREAMRNDVFGENVVLLGARNWVSVTEAEGGSYDNLNFQFRVERADKCGVNQFDVKVPHLQLQPHNDLGRLNLQHSTQWNSFPNV